MLHLRLRLAATHVILSDNQDLSRFPAYRAMFAAAYPSWPGGADAIDTMTFARASSAMAASVPSGSPVDGSPTDAYCKPY